MKDYIGKVCPFCRTEFTEEDDVVVCSDCDMPHHRACWIANKGCTTFGCQGSVEGISFDEEEPADDGPKYEVRDDAALMVIDTPKNCRKCGAELAAGSLFCSKCGTPVHASGPKVGSFDFKGSAAKAKDMVAGRINTLLAKFQTAVPLDSEMEEYIGTNKEYYMKSFRKIRETGKAYSWNWPAFLLTPFWFMYRKMYIPGAAILVINILLSLFHSVIASLLGLCISGLAGCLANFFYLFDLGKRIEIGRTLPEDQRYLYRMKRGDVDTLIPSIASVVFTLLWTLIMFQ